MYWKIEFYHPGKYQLTHWKLTFQFLLFKYSQWINYIQKSKLFYYIFLSNFYELNKITHFSQKFEAINSQPRYFLLKLSVSGWHLKKWLQTYPWWYEGAGTSMVCEAVLFRSVAISARRAKSVSWSARRADFLDSRRRTSSRRFCTSNGAWNK